MPIEWTNMTAKTSRWMEKREEKKKVSSIDVEQMDQWLVGRQIQVNFFKAPLEA